MFLEFISDTSNVIPPKTLDVSQGTEVIPPHQRVNLSGKPKRAPAPEPPSISEDLQIKKNTCWFFVETGLLPCRSILSGFSPKSLLDISNLSFKWVILKKQCFHHLRICSNMFCKFRTKVLELRLWGTCHDLAQLWPIYASTSVLEKLQMIFAVWCFLAGGGFFSLCFLWTLGSTLSFSSALISPRPTPQKWKPLTISAQMRGILIRKEGKVWVRKPPPQL